MFKSVPGDTPNFLNLLAVLTLQAPANVPDNVLAVYPGEGSDGECEISVASLGNIEAYMYRGTAAKDDQQQQCWDATENSK